LAILVEAASLAGLEASNARWLGATGFSLGALGAVVGIWWGGTAVFRAARARPRQSYGAVAGLLFVILNSAAALYSITAALLAEFGGT
jgi:hypothetical protein